VRAAFVAIGLVAALGVAVGAPQAEDATVAPAPTTAAPAAAAKDARGWTTHPSKQVAAGLPLLLGEQDLPAPKLDATLLTADGDSTTLADLVKRPTLLFYYSATCPHCIAVAPEIKRFADRLAGQVDVVAVASGGNGLSEIRQFGKDHGFSMPMVKDFTRKFARDNGARSTPTVWLVEPVEGGFRSLVEFRPFAPGSGLLAELKARAAVGGDPFEAFEEGRYYGSVACAGCHAQEYDSWGLTHHSIAYWTIHKQEKTGEAKCVTCHVTGMDTPTGFVLGDHGSALAEVGCESCHGPGGPHAGQRPDRAEARAVCVSCHDAEHSVAFDLDRALPHIDHFAGLAMDDDAYRAQREALVEGRAERPLLAFPEGANQGNAACKACHPAQVKAFKKDPHSKARKTLAERGSDQDPACMECHVLPKQDPATEAAHFFDGSIGCEQCHGPGEKHVQSGSKDDIVGLGESCPECIIEGICGSCHTPDQDPDWDLSVALPKIKH
jgi:thiol-disulfide isomerase/thioredoxin